MIKMKGKIMKNESPRESLFQRIISALIVTAMISLAATACGMVYFAAAY